MRYATYTLRIEHAEGEPLNEYELARLWSAIASAEDAVNDRLPAGYYCKIDQGSEGVDLAAVARLEEMGR